MACVTLSVVTPTTPTPTPTQPTPPSTQPTQIPWWAVAVAGGVAFMLLIAARR
jgi:hypothetical protein